LPRLAPAGATPSWSRYGNIAAIVAREAAEVELVRHVRAYRGDRRPLNVEECTVIVVDDGVTTGLTDTAALRAVRHQSPQQVILAVRICSPDAFKRLRAEADAVLRLRLSQVLRGVSEWCRDFSQVSDEEVLDALQPRANAAA
jgi:putative phosphoribosyl transferase